MNIDKRISIFLHFNRLLLQQFTKVTAGRMATTITEAIIIQKTSQLMHYTSHNKSEKNRHNISQQQQQHFDLCTFSSPVTASTVAVEHWG